MREREVCICEKNACACACDRCSRRVCCANKCAKTCFIINGAFKRTVADATLLSHFVKRNFFSFNPPHHRRPAAEQSTAATRTLQRTLQCI